MIYTPNNEPVSIVGQPMMNLLDPTTVYDPIVKVRFIGSGDECSARLSRLHASGGPTEIEAAIAKLQEAQP